MKKNYLKKTLLVALSVSVLAGTVLTGCGKNKEAETVAETSVSEEESNINPPFVDAAEQYDSVISQLQPGQAYAFADICSAYDVLLVADDVYDNLDGNMASIEATIYGLDADGNVMEYGTVNNGDTASPLAVYDGCLMVYSNHRTMMEYIDPDTCSVITRKCVEVSYDTDGNAIYFYMDNDGQEGGETEDDSMMIEMLEMYADAVIINFTVVE